ncbi:hypothetical protein AC481_00100 [miscellaneous Crenarchaeota group archaeon SMTZ-80]|nr:MAG: hypothetical protein AC481_00100 [miscellaneous Crenarchaeota group archaeon SMTZ-80]
MNMGLSIYSRAPVRICDIGGWTDTWFYKKGAVFNICVNLYSNVRILGNNLNTIRIISENLKLDTEIKDFNNIEYNGTLDLLKAAVKKMGIKRGIDIIVRAGSPPGSGTGTSASVAVALIAALAKYLKQDLKKSEIAKIAHKLETEELKLESGVQDQYAAAYGGINFMKIKYPSVKIYNIKIDEEKIYELETQMILVYLSSRSSNEMHKAVITNYLNKNENTLESFEVMKNCAYEMKKAIKSNLVDIGDVMNRNWNAQKKLHPLMVNPAIDNLEKIAKDNGAIGFKCNGAGGGGSAIILAGIDNKYNLSKNIIKAGYKLLPFKLDFDGVLSYHE